MHALLRVLKDEGADEHNPIHKSKVLNLIEQRLDAEGLLNEVDKTTNNSGRIRWIFRLGFYLIPLSVSDLAYRKRGQFWITERGKKLAEESTDDLYNIAWTEYKKWNARRKQSTKSTAPTLPETPTGTSEPDENIYDAPSILDNARSDALEGIKERLEKLDPYEFQDLVADILVAMGLNVEHVADKGPDRGIDITATTKDELGLPKLRVQVKRYTKSRTIPLKDVQALRGAIKTDAGMFVANSKFSDEAILEAAHAPSITLVGLDQLLDLLDQYYDNLPHRGKDLLPLKKVYFISDGE